MTTELQLGGVRAAMTVMGCDDLPPMLDFLVARLGWRIDAIFPADGPRHAMLSGHGARLHLRVGEPAGLAALELLCDDPDAVAGGQRELLAPNGVRVRLLHALRVIDAHLRAILHKAGDDGNGGTVAHVVGVGLEGQAEQRDLLAAGTLHAADGREHLAPHRARSSAKPVRSASRISGRWCGTSPRVAASSHRR